MTPCQGALSVSRAVSNHGLEELLEEQFKESRKFFELPLEEKNKTFTDANSRCDAANGLDGLLIETSQGTL